MNGVGDERSIFYWCRIPDSMVPLKTWCATQGNIAYVAPSGNPTSLVNGLFSVVVTTQHTLAPLVAIYLYKEVLANHARRARGMGRATNTSTTITVIPNKTSTNTLGKLQTSHLWPQPSVLSVDNVCIHCNMHKQNNSLHVG